MSSTAVEQNANNQDGQENTSRKYRIWKQLFLNKWHPIPTVCSTIVLFIIIGVIFLIIGIIISVFNSQIIECCDELKSYQVTCASLAVDDSSTVCDIEFTVSEDMKQPIFFFYNIDNFYQNHRRYIKSKSSKQLAGDVISIDDSESSCDPIILNSDLDETTGWGGVEALEENAVANPCGLIAKSFFKDTYELYDPDGERITIEETDIAWTDDIGDKFKRINGDEDQSKKEQWIDPENEHFIVWMRTSGLPNFRKLWGRIKDDMNKGTYKLRIDNTYDVEKFEGKKSVIMSTSGPLGGKNKFLSVAYIIVGIICFCISGVFAYKKNKNENFGKKIK